MLPAIRHKIRKLAKDGKKAPEIAALLKEKGVTNKFGNPVSAGNVYHLLSTKQKRRKKASTTASSERKKPKSNQLDAMKGYLFSHFTKKDLLLLAASIITHEIH